MPATIPLVMDYNRDDAVQQRLRAHHSTGTAIEYDVVLRGEPGRVWHLRGFVTTWAVDPGPVNGVPQLTVVLSAAAVPPRW